MNVKQFDTITVNNKMPRNPIIPYNPELKQKARELRRNATASEKTLWMVLRKKQLGYEFHRQVPIGNFIVDFYCHELRLVIEADGESHQWPGAPERDRNRQEQLEALGVRFLRFTDEQILGNVKKVVGEIKEWIEENGKC